MLSCRICGGSGSSAELSHVCKPMARAQMKQFIRRRCAHPGCPGTSLRIAIVRRMCHSLIQLLPRVWRIRNARHISCRHSGESGNPLALKINGFRLAPGSAGLAGMTAIYATNWRNGTLDRFQVFNKVVLFLFTHSYLEVTIIMIDDLP